MSMNIQIPQMDAFALANSIVETIREVQAGSKSDMDIVMELTQKLQDFVKAIYEPGCDCC